MSKLEVIILKYGNAVLDLPKTNDPIGKPIDEAKQQIKDLMLELIGEDYTTTTFGYDERTLKIANQVKTTMRQRVNDL